jgi:hypothetical protein
MLPLGSRVPASRSPQSSSVAGGEKKSTPASASDSYVWSTSSTRIERWSIPYWIVTEIAVALDRVLARRLEQIEVRPLRRYHPAIGVRVPLTLESECLIELKRRVKICDRDTDIINGFVHESILVY